MSDAKFLPPQQNLLLTRLIQSIFYLVAYFGYNMRVKFDDHDVDKLKAISQYRVVYLPNHSNLDDGLVVFLLSARLGQLFHYVVAYEAFQGLIGKLMQQVGAYSIRRGMGDRASIVQTLKILQQPKCKLVIFPEGGCSYQNDTVIPFRTGAIELSFKAMDKLAKQQAIVPDFYLVPVSLKYTYPKANDAQVAESLEGLETALSIEPTQPNFYLRLRAISAQVLTNLEAEYGVTSVEETDWNQRIETLKEHLLNYCEEKLDIAPATQLPNRERVYKIQAILRSLADSNKQPNINYHHLYQTTVRLLNFDAIYDGYVAAKPSPERFFATLDRLEREVFRFDRPKPKGFRKIIVTTGTPINLKEYYQDVVDDKTLTHFASRNRQKTINNLTQVIQQTVQANLN